MASKGNRSPEQQSYRGCARRRAVISGKATFDFSPALAR
jgi:hypothetical protein